jgi:hypothetical protein
MTTRVSLTNDAPQPRQAPPVPPSSATGAAADRAPDWTRLSRSELPSLRLAAFGLTPPGALAEAFVAAYSRSLLRGGAAQLTARELRFLCELAAWSRTLVYYRDVVPVIDSLRLLQSQQRSRLGTSQLDEPIRSAELRAAEFEKACRDYL